MSSISGRIELARTGPLYSLSQEGFDLAIRHTVTSPQTHIAWTLCETRSLLVTSGDYLDRWGTPAQPDDLTGHDCLRYLRGNEATVA